MPSKKKNLNTEADEFKALLTGGEVFYAEFSADGKLIKLDTNETKLNNFADTKGLT